MKNIIFSNLGLFLRHLTQWASLRSIDLEALSQLVLQRCDEEWAGLSLRNIRLGFPKPDGIYYQLKDFNAPASKTGEAILAGRFLLLDQELDLGPGENPWDQPVMTHLHAASLHQWHWLPDLISLGDVGVKEALRLFSLWHSQFGRTESFSWRPGILEVWAYHLACAAPKMITMASDFEARLLLSTLGKAGRRLAGLGQPLCRRIERLSVATMIASIVTSPSVETGFYNKYRKSCLNKLIIALRLGFSQDGRFLKTRMPEQGLKLLLLLLTLEDLFIQRGQVVPRAISTAIHTLTQAVRFFRLKDGGLAAFHGGATLNADIISTALSQGTPEKETSEQQHAEPISDWAGYYKISKGLIEVIVDAAPPPSGPWSLATCEQTLAIEIVCGKDRLISHSGWTPEGLLPQAFRLADAASQARLEGTKSGRLLSGWRLQGLGPRLISRIPDILVENFQNEWGHCLALSREIQIEDIIFDHQRRIFLNSETDELRGEDCFIPKNSTIIPFSLSCSVRFHMMPDVQVSLARDKRSVILRGPSDKGWWFRNDAKDVGIETSFHYDGRHIRRTTQIHLKTWIDPNQNLIRLRWKLVPVS